MRSKIEASEYKDYILGFIFYKFLSDREEQFLLKNGFDRESMETVRDDESLRERKYKLFGDKSKRAEKKAKREQARAMAKANPQIAFLAGAGAFEQMILRKNDVLYTQSGEGSKPLDGVVARVESGSEVESRITLTRLAILGPLALAAPKKKGGEKFVTIEGPDFLWCMEVPRKRASDAVRFAAKVNGQVKELLHQ